MIFNKEIDYEYGYDKFATQSGATRLIYWDLIAKTFRPNAVHRTCWEVDLNQKIDEKEWCLLFSNFRQEVKPQKLRLLQYRVLTRSLTTNKKCHIWNEAISPLCTFCAKEDETVAHLFLYCENIQELWYKLQRVIRYFINIEVIFTDELILFNNYNGKEHLLVNLLISIMKQYIYATKCRNKTPMFTAYMSKVSEYYCTEKAYANTVKKCKKLQTKWKNFF